MGDLTQVKTALMHLNAVIIVHYIIRHNVYCAKYRPERQSFGIELLIARLGTLITELPPTNLATTL